MKAAIYCRVANAEGDITTQEEICQDYCEQSCHEVYRIYTDNGISGMKDNRPAFDELLRDMRLMKFNSIVVTKLDRLTRSLPFIVTLLNEIKKSGIQLIEVGHKRAR